MKDEQATGTRKTAGRFAPSPTGRMHAGNVYAALVSWLSAKSQGGKWILRIEDLDPDRSKDTWAKQIEDDLAWLGLDWDEGGTEDRGENGPYRQSRRGDRYEAALGRLREMGYTYPCHCTRAELRATQAPHAGDSGRNIYAGTCRPGKMPREGADAELEKGSTVRLWVPDGVTVEFTDRTYGKQRVEVDKEVGDFAVRRADGAWAYQLAVVVDDIEMGVTEVVRGWDLLDSAAQQTYLCGLLGQEAPEYAHIPLVCNESGTRLSKRDHSLSMEELRKRFTPEELTGRIAYMGGLTAEPTATSARELLKDFTWDKIPRTERVTASAELFE